MTEMCMLRWKTLFTAGILLLATSCGGSQTAQPTVAPSETAPLATATTAPTATVAPTSAGTETATNAPAATATSAPTATTAAATATQAPEATTTPAATTVSTPAGNQTTPGDFTPKVRSVWNTSIGLDQMTGNCPKGSMLPVYGLVQITPNGSTLSWKNQEPAPYTFKRLETNVFQYAGPTAIKDGVVTMTLKFLDEKSLEMNREFVSNADPGCVHKHAYTGVFQWNKP
jgi:hypothetical protein